MERSCIAFNVSGSHLSTYHGVVQVPSKQALDAALRCLTTAATFDSNTRALLASSGHMTEVLVPLVQLLQHHSIRVQLRAIGLLRMLLQSPELLEAALLSGAPRALAQMLKDSGFGAIKIETAQAS